MSRVLSVENVRKCSRLRWRADEAGKPPRIRADRGDVHTLGRERRAHEAAHVFVADARQHRDLQAEPRKAHGDVLRRSAQVFCEMLRIFELRAEFEAVEVHRRAAEANEIDGRRHLCLAGA